MRGLSYYTGIVFEAVSKSSTLQRAICGGGRYDTILETFGAKKVTIQQLKLNIIVECSSLWIWIWRLCDCRALARTE